LPCVDDVECAITSVFGKSYVRSYRL